MNNNAENAAEPYGPATRQHTRSQAIADGSPPAANHFSGGDTVCYPDDMVCRPIQGDRQNRKESMKTREMLAAAALAILGSGCAATRPLKGGKAVTTPKPTGGVEQTLTQGESPSRATKQDQETIKVRTYTLPAGSRIEQSAPPATTRPIPQSPSAASPS
jgi:hypothetical protein